MALLGTSPSLHTSVPLWWSQHRYQEGIMWQILPGNVTCRYLWFYFRSVPSDPLPPPLLKALTNSSTLTLVCLSRILRRHLNIQVFKALHYPKVLSEFFLRPQKWTATPTFTALQPAPFYLLKLTFVSCLLKVRFPSRYTTKIGGVMLGLCPEPMKGEAVSRPCVAVL